MVNIHTSAAHRAGFVPAFLVPVQKEKKKTLSLLLGAQSFKYHKKQTLHSQDHSSFSTDAVQRDCDNISMLILAQSCPI